MTARSQAIRVRPLLFALALALGLGLGTTLVSGVAEATHPDSRGIDRACPTEAQQNREFVDTVGNVHEEAINCLAFYDIVEGRSPGQYEPRLEVGRAPMATFIADTMEVAGFTFDDSASFSDTEGTVHRGNIERLAGADVVEGYADGTYRPALDVSRAQMATYIAAMIETVSGEPLTIDDAHDPAFSDTAGNVHEGSIDKLAAVGVVVGRDGERYDPQAPVTRDAMASFVARGADVLAERGAWAPTSDDDDDEAEDATDGEYSGQLDALREAEDELDVRTTLEGLLTFAYDNGDTFLVNEALVDVDDFECAARATLDADAEHLIAIDYAVEGSSMFALATSADVDACDLDDGDNGDNGDTGDAEPADSGVYNGQLTELRADQNEFEAQTLLAGLLTFAYDEEDTFIVNGELFAGAEAFECAAAATVEEDPENLMDIVYETEGTSEFALTTAADLSDCDTGILGS